MSPDPPTRVVGCLLDVSHSMRKTLETGQTDNDAIERLQAVLSAALKFAQAEQRREASALLFVGLFGLNPSAGCPPVVDLCGVIEALLVSDNEDASRSGHDLLIELANDNNLPHITKYIRSKLTEQQALIIHAHLQRHRERTREFVDAIPSEDAMKNSRSMITGVSNAGVLIVSVLFPSLGVDGWLAGAYHGFKAGEAAGGAVEDHAVDNSEALRLARQICDEWLHDFTTLVPRPVDQVVQLLQRLQSRRGEAHDESGDKENLLDTLGRYLYGRTPMKDALRSSLATFREHPLAAQGGSIQQRVLLVISDGRWTDDDPFPIVAELHNYQVTIATVFLTRHKSVPRRSLVDKAGVGWHMGQRALFDMASRISCTTHPVPVLGSVGWTVPSSGECALYTTVCSVSALEEFCSLLSSAAFGSADMLLDLVGRMDLDAYIDDEHIRTLGMPSNQGRSPTCYAHAIAAVVHMALLRIVGREGGCPSIREIREWILHEDNFPAPEEGTDEGWRVEDVLNAISEQYPPLRFQRVDEDGARQAVLHRRPVLATFFLSTEGWRTFSSHFENDATCTSVLTYDEMEPHRDKEPDEAGHAVVLTGCDPVSLTFLNSWGKDWGNNGSFSIENPSVLELDGESKTQMGFYDVYWLESDLTDDEREAYKAKVDEKLRSHSSEYPSIFELDTRCPLCLEIAPIREFSGNIRQATCPRCCKSFHPEPGHLVQALYAQAGLGDR